VSTQISTLGAHSGIGRSGHFRDADDAPLAHASIPVENHGVPSFIEVSALTARRFALRALGLESAWSTIGAALDHLGYVQIDPLNICGRMHDLILRNRVAGYREGALMRYVHGAPESPIPGEARRAFEHHHPGTHVLVVFPLDAWPHLVGAMRGRSRVSSAWMGRLTPTERKLAPRLLAEIEARGPLASEDFADDRRAHRIVWGAASLVKSTLQKLFFHGRLLIAQRDNNRRRYDLPERVLPAHTLVQSEAPAEETRRWLALLKLRQRRLVTLTREELRTVGDAVQAVQVDGCPMLYCLSSDVESLQEIAESETNCAASKSAAKVRLLAPLDPLIYDRRVTAALWNFDYTWEAYTPPAKRVRGHYALPVLAGTELVGHVEPKANRTTKKLVVASRSLRRGFVARTAVQELAAWLGLK
jgi:uncharacterized protein